MDDSPLKRSNTTGKLGLGSKISRQQLLSLHSRLDNKTRPKHDDDLPRTEHQETRQLWDSLQKSPMKLVHNAREKENTSPAYKKFTKMDLTLKQKPSSVVDLMGSPDKTDIPLKRLAATPKSMSIKKGRNETQTSPSPRPRILSGERDPNMRTLSSPVKESHSRPNGVRPGSNSSSSKSVIDHGSRPNIGELPVSARKEIPLKKRDEPKLYEAVVGPENKDSIGEIERLKAQHVVEIISWKARLSGKDSELKLVKTALLNAEEKSQASQRVLDQTVDQIHKELHEKYQSKHHQRVTALKKELTEQYVADKQNLQIEYEMAYKERAILQDELNTVQTENQELLDEIAKLQSQLASIDSIHQQTIKHHQDDSEVLRKEYETQLQEKDKQLEEFFVVLEEYQKLMGQGKDEGDEDNEY